MKNLDKHEWDFTNYELQAINELEGKGFNVTINKRSVTKDNLTIERGGFQWDIDIPLGRRNISYVGYVEMVEQTFEMAKKLM